MTGGAIYNEGELTLADSTLQGNAATSGGAINLGNTSRTSLRNVSVIGNTSTGNGGGIHVSSGSYLTIAGGNIASNQAGGNGDAIRVNSADFYLTENAVVDSDNDIYLERSCTVKTIGTGIGNTEKNPLRITLADTNYGTVVVENDSTGEAARIGSNVVCLDKEGNVLESTAFDTFLVLGKQEEIDYVARIADGNGSYRYFTSLNAAINAAATDGSQTRIEVLADITLKASVDIPQDGNRNILLTDDGNGPYTITRAFTGGRMIILRTGNRLTLAGSSGSDRNPSLILDGGGLEAEKDQQIICVGTTATNKNAALTLNAGVKLANNNNSNGGGAVIVYGSLTMNGGVIEGNASANDHGGAVYVMATGEMAMNGGTIRDNKSKLDGGAVMVNGSGRLTMTGGTITGNEARSGGAIILNYASSACGAMTMSGGTIRDNTATNNGGAIFVHARGALTMSGGTISGNEGGNGGAVYLHYNASNGVGVMTMSGGTISGNTASGNGGGVGMANASNTLTVTGGTVRSNTSGGSGADVYAVGALTMESAADVGSLYLTDDNRITLSGPLSDRSTVTEVVLGAYPEGRKVLDGDAAAVASGHAFFETPEGSGVDIDAAGCLVSNGESADYEARIVNPDGSWTGYMTLQAAIDAAVTDGSQTRIEVMKDITLTAALDIPENGNRNILLTDDGNGPYTITRDFTGGTMIILRTGNEMTLEGSSGDDGSPSLILDGAGLAAASDQGIIKVGTNTSKNYHATLTVNAGVKLTNNKSGSNGSAIRVYGNLNMNGGVLEGNETTGTGGAVSVELTGTMTMTGGTISSNKSAKEGGGIVVYGSGELTIEDGTITGNRGTAGGAICTLFSSGAGGTVTVSGGTISDNTGSGNGGAIFIHAKGLLTVTGGTITGNQGNHGGAIYLHYNATNGTGTLNMSGGTISDNTAKGNGGGVGMANAANTMTMTGGTISGNTAGGTGDGIHAAGTLNMAGTAYADEIYLPAGKAVNLTAALSQREEAMTLVLPGDSYTPGRKVLDGEEAVIAGSYAYFQVPEESGTAIDSTGCLTATGEDVDYEARIVNPDGSWTDYMTLAEAVSAAATDGSQTRIEVMKDLTLTAALDIPQDGNRNILLTDDGNGPYTITRGFTGGRMIILRTGNQMTLAGSSGNDDEPSLIFDGAGLAASSNQQIICVGTSTTRKDATLTLNAGVKLTNNQNANGGGAVIVYGRLTMNGGVIEGNASTGDNSGAVHVMATGEMIMNGGAIRDNTANKNGGAIYVLGKLTLTDGAISGNQCSGDGGAIYVNNRASMVMEGGTISGNTSASEGGGILVNGTGTLTIEDGTITGNETTGAAGGAICTLFSEGAGGTVTIHGGTITENKASGNGGAIFIHARGLLTVTGGTITGNQGNHGGAIYLHYNATNGTGTLTMSGGTISDNTAKGNGGGVGMANAANTMTMTGGTISGNTAGGTGDGIHAAGTLNMAGTAYADEIYLPAGKAVNLTEVLSSRENLIKIVMPVYEDGTHVLTGDALVLAESYGNFTPENAGYIINDEGVLEVNASIVDTTWHLGYVGSNTNVNHANQIVIGTSGNYYSYSDVITIEKAGTKIWFTDDNTNANGDSLYASTAAYVISSWKQEDNDWVIDLESANYCGSTSNTSEIASYDNGAVTYTYVTSEDNEHIRLCFRSGEKADFTPEIYPTIYMQMTEEYGTFAHIKWANESKKNSYFETLEGKTIYAIGDSYFAGNGLDKRFVWPELLSVKYNCMFNNYGINGNALSSYNNASNPMVTRYTTMAVAEPDIIFVEGGKNDYNRNTPLGTVDSMDTDTFMGALNVLLCGLHDRYPNAQIMCFTVWNVNQTNSLGLTVNDYGKAMQAVCKERNVPCFDAMDIKATGVNMNDATFRAQYCMLPNDVSHLNVEGMKLVFPVVESFVAQAYEERLEFNRIEVSPENAVAKIGNIYYETLQAAVNAVPTTGVETKIEITKSISLDKPLDVPESGNRNFILTDDGNGPYTITRNFSGDRMIILRKGNIMTLQGTGTDEKPTLIIDGNGENVAAGVNGQAIAVGTSNVNYDATMNIKTGVKIHNNACNSNGGGIAVFGTVNMEGGVITDNRTTGTGGGIIVCNYGHLNMTGGTISGNMAATGNDIHVMNTMNISGKVEIGYIYLSTDKKIALEEGFVTENIIEVVMPDYEVDTQVLTGEATVLTESYSYFKVPDSSGMVITAAGTLGNSININDVAGLTLKNVLSQIMYQVQMQFCRTAGIVMNF